MARVHPSAVVDAKAELDSDVEVGPFAVIGPGVRVGGGTRVGSHAVLDGRTTIGRDNRIFPFCSLGTEPQDKKYRGESTELQIGDRNTIREYCLVNTGTVQDGGVTRIGSDNWIMGYVHLAHDCIVGDHTIIANAAQFAGHVQIGDWVLVGGTAAVHQFVRIGEGAMIAGLCGVRADVIPFAFCIGVLGRLNGLNIVGLRRRKMSRTDLHVLRRVYLILFRGEGLFAERLEAVERDYADNPYAARIIAFIRSGGKRPLLMAWERGRATGEALDAPP